jgi:hypothetical protein
LGAKQIVVAPMLVMTISVVPGFFAWVCLSFNQYNYLNDIFAAGTAPAKEG